MQPVARAVQGVSEWIISSGYIKTRTDRCQKMREEKDIDTHQDDEKTEMASQDFDMVRSKVFNIQSVRSVMIAKLKQRQSKTDT